MKQSFLIKLLGISLFLSPMSYANNADTFNEQLLNIQHKWAKVNYTLQDEAQEEAFKSLITSAESLTQAYPSKAEAYVWQGIIQSSYAGAKGGIGALSYAKDAKKSLEKAIKIDATVLSGSAYTSLGTLYHKVPSWPIGFGNDNDAREFLEKAIALNPDGIDSNYFYAEFLFDEAQYSKAKEYLMRALEAPERPDRPLADESRRAEVEALLARVENKMSKKKS